ncbi:MAG TPA: YdeI/OmpD-associated family protein [Chitinophagaceae bacterium]|nr:YdeI/OmpD-associated family protein [Chitinophagaceae bacterium]
MIEFKTIIKKFNDQGEKTGWTYIEVSAAIAEKLKPNNKKSFRVKGSLDDYLFEGLALIPMGEGNFILALKADIRKKIRKQKGDFLNVKIEVDNNPVKMNELLMECLADEPESLSFFNSLTPGHRKYFSNWIDSAKTDATKTKRIAQTINALSKKWDYGQMIRAQSLNKKDKLL